MPLMHRSIYHSDDGLGLLESADEVFLGWLESRGQHSNPVNIDLIGREGDYAEVGAGHRARIDSITNGEGKATRYSQMVIGENGTYSTHMTAVMDGTGAWVQLDVHAPHQNSNFHAPLIPSLLLDKASSKGLRLTNGNPAEVFTPAPRRVQVDEVGKLLDEIINHEDRRSTALVAGIQGNDNYHAWSERFERWFSFSRGVATLWLLDGEATEEFNSMVAKEYQVYPRSIHSFQPLADTENPDDAYRHRWFSSHDLYENQKSKQNQSRLYHLSRRAALKQRSPLAVEAAEKKLSSRVAQLQVNQGTEDSPFRDRIQKIRATWPTIPTVQPTRTTPDSTPVTDKAPVRTRRHTPMLPPRVRPTPPDVRPPIADPTPVADPSTAPAKPEGSEAATALTNLEETIREFCGTIGFTPSEDQDTEDILLEVFDRVWKSQRAVANAETIIAGKDELIAELEDDNSTLQEAWDEAVSVASNLDLSLAESQRRIQYYSLQLQALKAPKSAYSLPTVDRPTSMATVLKWLSSGKLQRVVFTGDRKKALDLDNRRNAESIAQICWDFLQTLDDYAKQCKQGHTSVDSYITENETLAHPAKFARTESKLVRENTQFRQARSFKVPAEISADERVFMWAHYRLAQDGGKAPRLHYHDATRTDGRIYVGYIGEHLLSPMTT